MAVYEAIRNLVQYGVNTGLLQESDRIYATNQILEVLGLDEYEEPQGACREISLEETLDALLDYAHETGVLKEDGVVYRDLFDTKLMNCLMPRPSEVIGHFWKLYEESPEAATNYYYKLSQDSNYIRRYRVSKDMKWKTDTKYGELDITVNLSKPECFQSPGSADPHISPARTHRTQTKENHSNGICGRRTGCVYIIPLFLVQLQDAHKCLLRNLYVSDLTHTFLSFLLLLQKFSLSGNIAAVAFCQNVLPHCLDRLAGNDLSTNRRLDWNLK